MVVSATVVAPVKKIYKSSLKLAELSNQEKSG